MSEIKPVRWGIMGCANIANKYAKAILMAPNSKLVAVASRSMKKAEDFLTSCPLPSEYKSHIRLIESYEALLQDPDVDVVYMPLPTSLHLQWAVRVARAKKHLLMEKPCALNLRDLQTIVDECRSNGVVLMDGVMFMHHERMSKLRQCLSDSLLGTVRRVSSSFSFNGGADFLAQNIRVRADGDPLGALGDLGWYCVRLGIVAMNRGAELQGGRLASVPLTCSATCDQCSADGVPLDCSAVVTFGPAGLNPDSNSSPIDNMCSKLHFDCSFVMPFRQTFEVLITGSGPDQSDRVISCDDFVIPRRPGEACFEVEAAHPAGALADTASRVFSCVERHRVQPALPQEADMAVAFSEVVLGLRAGGQALQQVEYFQQVALLTQAVVDACYTSLRDAGAAVPVDTSFLK